MDTSHSSGDQPLPANEKKTYEKPGFRYEQVFVTSALTCGKVTGGIGSMCHMNKKS